jgi:hypothetical protein
MDVFIDIKDYGTFVVIRRLALRGVGATLWAGDQTRSFLKAAINIFAIYGAIYPMNR